MGDQVGIIVLAELDPAGGAGGDHREDAAVLHALDELGTLFHNGEVSAEVGVEDLIKAQHMQRGGHLAGDERADRHAEAFAESGADRRRGVNDNVLGRIGQSREDLGGVVLFYQSAGGADNGALTAADAGNVAQLLVKGAADLSIKAAVVGADNADVLFFTSGHAAAAKDTLVVIADEVQGRVILIIVGLFAFELNLVYAVLKTQLLQLAVVGTRAGQTLFIVVGEQELKGCLAVFADLGGVGKDLGALTVNGIDAGGD